MMDLNDLLAEVESLGEDQFVSSGNLATQTMTANRAMNDAQAATEDVVDEMLDAMTETAALQLGSLDMVLDVELELLVELGEARLPLRDLLRIQPGDAIPLAHRPSDPLKIFVNDRLVAHGEPLIVNGMLAVKIVELFTPQN